MFISPKLIKLWQLAQESN